MDALLRHLTPLRHPYLLGGAISGALMAGVVAAFIAVTGLVAHRGLPDATPGISSSPSGTLTIPIAHAHPSRHAPGALTAATRSTPFSLTVPTTSITAPPPTVTAAVARTPTGAGQPSRHRHPARHRDGKSGGRGGRSPSDSGVLAKVGTTQTQTTQGAAAKTGAGDATPAPAAHTSAPSVAPSTTHGPSSPPPGLAKKPGGLPPGLAKKPGGLPPGQAKKHG